MIRAARISMFLVAVLAATPVAADESPVEVSLEPWAAFDGVDRPHRYIVTMRATRAAEVVADRRLLSFEVRPEGSRRRHRCRHPQAPRRTPDARVRALAAGEVWREWVDLRMYCWGRALTGLETGGEVHVRYGFRRRARTRWIARVPETPWREWTGGVEPEPFHFASTDRAGTPGETPAEDGDEDAIRVSLSTGSARGASSVRFRVAVRAAAGRARVFLRPTDFRFLVQGPESEARCELEGSRGSPPPDLFRRLSTRVAWREMLEAEQFCPEDAFERAGVYEITPELELVHDGADYELDAPTGTFVGDPVAFRITSGEQGYVEQIPERADE